MEEEIFHFVSISWTVFRPGVRVGIFFLVLITFVFWICLFFVCPYFVFHEDTKLKYTPCTLRIHLIHRKAKYRSATIRYRLMFFHAIVLSPRTSKIDFCDHYRRFFFIDLRTSELRSLDVLIPDRTFLCPQIRPIWLGRLFQLHVYTYIIFFTVSSVIWIA